MLLSSLQRATRSAGFSEPRFSELPGGRRGARAAQFQRAERGRHLHMETVIAVDFLHVLDVLVYFIKRIVVLIV